VYITILTGNNFSKSSYVRPKTARLLKLACSFQTYGRAYFKQDLQLHTTWQQANWQCNNCTFYTAHFDFTTAQIV